VNFASASAKRRPSKSRVASTSNGRAAAGVERGSGALDAVVTGFGKRRGGLAEEGKLLA